MPKRLEAHPAGVAEGAAAAGRIEHGLIRLSEVLPWLDSDRYMSKRTASRYTELSVNRLEEAYRKGELRAFNTGKKILFRKSDIDAWFEAHQVMPAKSAKPDRGPLSSMLDKVIQTANRNVEARKRGKDEHGTQQI